MVGHTLAHSPPKFPCRWKFPSSVHINPDHTIRKTFNFSPDNPAPHLVDLLDSITQARAITNALTRYQSNPQKAPPWLDIIHARNALQYRLISLPAFEGLVGREDAMYDAVRLSVLIYSEMVTFPFPDVTGVKPNLATRLRRALDCCTMHKCWETSSAVMLWVSTLGAVAATNTPDRAWYVAKCKMCLEMLEIDDCARYLRLMKLFLWWEDVCEEPAMILWDETRIAEMALRSKRAPV